MKRPDKWDRMAAKVLRHVQVCVTRRAQEVQIANALRRTYAAAEKRGRKLAQSEYLKTPQWRICHEAYQEGWNAGFARGKYLQEAADQAKAAEKRGRLMPNIVVTHGAPANASPPSWKKRRNHAR